MAEAAGGPTDDHLRALIRAAVEEAVFDIFDIDPEDRVARRALREIVPKALAAQHRQDTRYENWKLETVKALLTFGGGLALAWLTAHFHLIGGP